MAERLKLGGNSLRLAFPEGGFMSRRIAVLVGVVTIVFSAVPSARAWGCKGHQTVALIAEKSPLI